MSAKKPPPKSIFHLMRVEVKRCHLNCCPAVLHFNNEIHCKVFLLVGRFKNCQLFTARIPIWKYPFWGFFIFKMYLLRWF